MPHEYLQYNDNSTQLEGYLAYPDNAPSCPLVLIAHAWRGRDAFVCQKANELAQLGYAGFALDMFGKGILGRSIEENSRLIKPFLDDRELLRQRILLALNIAQKHPRVDNKRIAAMGYCFGGLCVLDLARSGADIRGVISFHGLLNPPTNISQPAITAKVLVLHGYNDPMVPPQEVHNFAEEMQLRNVDWQIHMYGNTQHAFTNPEANDTTLGTIYNSVAADRSWQSMQNFLQEIF